MIPGDINRQVIRLLATAPLVLCDLKERNANAYYELAIRHAVGLPCVHLLRQGEESSPFDVSTMRTVAYSASDIVCTASPGATPSSTSSPPCGACLV